MNAQSFSQTGLLWVRIALLAQGICFHYVRNIRKVQQNSGKFRLRRRLLYDKRPAKNATSSFLLFSLFQ